MNSFEGATHREHPEDFRSLVGTLVEHSRLFPPRKFGKEEVTVVDAIERNIVPLYLPENPTDEMSEAIHCLTTIHDELQKGEPDEELIKNAVEQLKTYL